MGKFKDEMGLRLVFINQDRSIKMKVKIKTDSLLAIPELKATIDKYVIENRPRYMEGENLVIPFEDLYDDMFKLLYSKNAIMDDLLAYIEIPTSKLLEFVPDNFADNMLDGKQRIFENYFLSCMKKKETCLVQIGHLETAINRFALTKNAELRLFVEYFGNNDLTNIFTHTDSIATAKERYIMPILSRSNIENMTKASIINFIEEWVLDINTDQLKDKLVIELINIMGV